MYAIIKIFTSAIIIGVITEIARRFPTQGGLIAALPIVSLLSLIWLNVQGEQVQALSKFAYGVVLGIPGTVVMLLIIGVALQHSIHLVTSIGLGIIGWLVYIFAQDLVVKHLF
ncbi:hypothetical protein CN514_15730 [Bacillus sp. AFS001701]|uniref:DUF3147 family protein n=1 Tax=Bacillus sp. AFS001701 TaxID=2033480 RepID=UPI000BF2614B|nr:DUF3147 family protein [Bacillus sp. AFS001701]PET56741.1 hypothetical protein CN514_15730 [Bacillus sp. AFS001701]